MQKIWNIEFLWMMDDRKRNKRLTGESWSKACKQFRDIKSLWVMDDRKMSKGLTGESWLKACKKFRDMESLWVMDDRKRGKRFWHDNLKIGFCPHWPIAAFGCKTIRCRRMLLP